MKTPKKRLVKLVLSLKVGPDVEDQEVVYAVKRGATQMLAASRITGLDIATLKIRPHRSSAGKSASRKVVERVSGVKSSTRGPRKNRG